MFKLIDVNNDGEITLNQIVAAMDRIEWYELAVENVKQLT